MTRGRYDEAEKIILKMAKRNGKPLPDLSLLRSFAKVGHSLVCLSKPYIHVPLLLCGGQVE